MATMTPEKIAQLLAIINTRLGQPQVPPTYQEHTEREHDIQEVKRLFFIFYKSHIYGDEILDKYTGTIMNFWCYGYFSKYDISSLLTEHQYITNHLYEPHTNWTDYANEISRGGFLDLSFPREIKEPDD